MIELAVLLGAFTVVFWGFTLWTLRTHPVRPPEPLVDYRRPLRREEILRGTYPIMATSSDCASVVYFAPEERW